MRAQIDIDPIVVWSSAAKLYWFFLYRLRPNSKHSQFTVDLFGSNSVRSAPVSRQTRCQIYDMRPWLLKFVLQISFMLKIHGKSFLLSLIYLSMKVSSISLFSLAKGTRKIPIQVFCSWAEISRTCTWLFSSSLLEEDKSDSCLVSFYFMGYSAIQHTRKEFGCP